MSATSIRRLLFSILLITRVSPCFGVFIYTDKALFDADIAGMNSNFEDFEGFAGDGSVADNALLLPNFFINDQDPFLDVVVTDEFDASSGQNAVGIIDPLICGCRPPTSEALEGDDLNFIFPSPINAFGVNVIVRGGLDDFGLPRDVMDGDLDFDIEEPTTQDDLIVLDTANQVGPTLPDGGRVFFFGVIDLVNPFTEVQVDGNTLQIVEYAYGYTIDDVTTAAVPEPNAWALMGLCGLMVVARRWVSRRSVGRFFA